MTMTAIIGQPIDRIDGPLKVSGRATYAAEYWNVGRPLYGFIVGATIGKGRIGAIDTARAERAPGVRLVMTHLNAPAQGKADPSIMSAYSRAFPTLDGPEIHHYGEPVALVVAATYEQARAAAALVEVAYAAEPGRYDLAARLDQAYAPKTVNAGLATDSAIGDFDAAFLNSEVKVDATYTTPYQFSQPLEPHACLAVPDGDELTIYVCAQIVAEARTAIASTLMIDPARTHIVSEFVGGGFGSKLGIHSETILAAFAARALKQPVKVVMTRQQIFHLLGVRSMTSQRVRLGAARDGRLVALGHDVTMHTSTLSEYAEQTATSARPMYAAANRLTRHRLVELDIPRGEDVRSPGEAPGLLAIESAIDELAVALDVDPIELRIRNEPAVHPETGQPFSDRRLVECLREGAARFGWNARPKRPGSLRDGRWLVGYGVASAVRMQFQLPSKATVRMGADGKVLVRSDITDIGTGTYTIVAQVAADTLGVPLSHVKVEIGHSDYPPGAGSGGSFGATNTCTAVYNACIALQEKLRTGDVPPEGLEAAGEIGAMWDDPNYAKYSIYAYGAHFAEVGVDADTAEVRLRRMLGVFSAGRIFNAKTARSQLIGGMVFGISSALHEEALVEPRSGAFLNRDLAGYLVPVHADIGNIDAVLLEGFDPHANVLGAKGVGELGNCGANAAVANAVFNATGVRVRDFPITIEKLLPGLPLLDE
jgi:xanthine dehydrogenase YagR molybdenum-binding subunit